MLEIADGPLPHVEKISLTGVILAGGKSRRMGGFPKALLAFHHEKLVQRQIRLMKQICAEIILVANEPRTFLPHVDSDIRVITDYYPGTGPLGGMHAAFSLAGHANIWLVGCDMPFISPKAAKLMLDLKEERNSGAVVPCIDDRLHPLHGIYDKRCTDKIQTMISKDQYRVADLLGMIACERVTTSVFQRYGIDSRFVVNVNTPEEYERSLLIDNRAEEG